MLNLILGLLLIFLFFAIITVQGKRTILVMSSLLCFLSSFFLLSEIVIPEVSAVIAVGLTVGFIFLLKSVYKVSLAILGVGCGFAVGSLISNIFMPGQDLNTTSILIIGLFSVLFALLFAIGSDFLMYFLTSIGGGLVLGITTLFIVSNITTLNRFASEGEFLNVMKSLIGHICGMATMDNLILILVFSAIYAAGGVYIQLKTRGKEKEKKKKR